MHPSVTEHVPLHSNSLCKKYGTSVWGWGANNLHPTSWGHKQKRSKFLMLRPFNFLIDCNPVLSTGRTGPHCGSLPMLYLYCAIFSGFFLRSQLFYWCVYSNRSIVFCCFFYRVFNILLLLFFIIKMLCK